MLGLLLSVPSQNSNDTEDISTPNGNSNLSSKVELDMDDAPFLMDDEDEPTAETAESDESKQAVPSLDAEVPSSGAVKKKQKLFPIILVALVALGGAGAYFFLFKSETPKIDTTKENVIVVERWKDEVSAAKPLDNVLHFAPFVVEVDDPEGNLHLLSLDFAVVTNTRQAFGEIRLKLPSLRDDIYAALKSKPFASYASTKSEDDIKLLLAGTINDSLGFPQVTLIQENELGLEHENAPEPQISEILIQTYILQ